MSTAELEVMFGRSVADKEVSKASRETRGHSATMVPLFAFGPGSVVFAGLKDNTFIGKQLIKYVNK
jgi:alkaline phosphatase